MLILGRLRELRLLSNAHKAETVVDTAMLQYFSWRPKTSMLCYMAKLIKMSKSITNSRTTEKLCQARFRPTALPVGVFRLMPSPGGISPLTCTIFDPTYFWVILRNYVFHISPTRLKISIMGNYLDFTLKIAHRGNTGSHKGKRKMFCMLG